VEPWDIFTTAVYSEAGKFIITENEFIKFKNMTDAVTNLVYLSNKEGERQKYLRSVVDQSEEFRLTSYISSIW
jgi:hypothetical protein